MSKLTKQWNGNKCVVSSKHPTRWIAFLGELCRPGEEPPKIIEGEFGGKFRVFFWHHKVVDHAHGEEIVLICYRQAASDHQFIIIDL